MKTCKSLWIDRVVESDSLGLFRAGSFWGRVQRLSSLLRPLKSRKGQPATVDLLKAQCPVFVFGNLSNFFAKPLWYPKETRIASQRQSRKIRIHRWMWRVMRTKRDYFDRQDIWHRTIWEAQRTRRRLSSEALMLKIGWGFGRRRRVKTFGRSNDPRICLGICYGWFWSLMKRFNYSNIICERPTLFLIQECLLRWLPRSMMWMADSRGSRACCNFTEKWPQWVYPTACDKSPTGWTALGPYIHLSKMDWLDFACVFVGCVFVCVCVAVAVKSYMSLLNIRSHTSTHTLLLHTAHTSYFYRLHCLHVMLHGAMSPLWVRRQGKMLASPWRFSSSSPVKRKAPAVSGGLGTCLRKSLL